MVYNKNMIAPELKKEFLKALREDPDFRDEVRSLLLSKELLELPERFSKFEERMLKFQEDMEQFRRDMEQFRRDMEQFRRDTEEFKKETQRNFKEVWTVLNRLTKEVERIRTVELAEVKNVVSEAPGKEHVLLYFKTGWRKKKFEINELSIFDLMDYLKRKDIAPVPNAVFELKHRDTGKRLFIFEEASWRFDRNHAEKIAKWLKYMDFPVLVFYYTKETNRERIKDFIEKDLKEIFEREGLGFDIPLILASPNYYKIFGEIPEGKDELPPEFKKLI